MAGKLYPQKPSTPTGPPMDPASDMPTGPARPAWAQPQAAATPKSVGLPNSAASPPGAPPANPPAVRAAEPVAAVPINRNAPSQSTVTSMADVSRGVQDQRKRLRSVAAGSDKPARLVSLDAFRGFIMTMLAAKGFGLLAFSRHDIDSPVWQSHDYDLWQRIGKHFDHPLWISAFDFYKVSFWDLIQPAFMFMVGAAMPFSNARRESQGDGFISRGFHALIRSVMLVLLGVFLSSMGKDRTLWVFPNVLCQIGLGYFFAWLLLNMRWTFQVVALMMILFGYWGWFAMTPPSADYDYAAVKAREEEGEIFKGKFAPWSKNANAAYYFDAWLLPQLRSVPEPEPEAELKPQAAGHVALEPRFVSMTLQESAPITAEPTPETRAVETTGSDELEPSTINVGSQEERPDEPVPPLSEPTVVTETAPAESGLATLEPDTTTARVADTETTETPAEAEPAKPGWIRQWFFSSTEPYTPNEGGYTTLNFVPSIGTMLLGILCGNLLMDKEKSRWAKLGLLIVAAGVCLGLGMLAHSAACPIVKRIWTPSWVLFSGGYVIGMLALFYFLFDIAPLRLLAFPLVVVGMNSILIYLLAQTNSGWVQKNVVMVHLAGMINSVFGPKALDPQWYGVITLPTTVFAIYWLFLLWLYRQRIFLKL
jgi:predicted acyltransferase